MNDVGQLHLQGYMEKKSDHVHQWRQRYFVLRGKYLIYTKSEEESIHTPRGVITLTGCTVEEDGLDSTKTKYRFSVKPSRGRAYHFQTDARTTMDEWMDAIDIAASGAKGPLLEYRGRRISDPHDAKEIVMANAEMQEWAYSQYETAYDSVLQTLVSKHKGIQKMQNLQLEKKALSHQVRSLRKEIKKLQESYVKCTDLLNKLKELETDDASNLYPLLDGVSKLRTDLEQSHTEYLGNLAGNGHMGPEELLKMSTNMLKYFEAHIESSLPPPPPPVVLPEDAVSNDSQPLSSMSPVRRLMIQLLTYNAELRRSINDYNHHTYMFTQAKLEQFERQQGDRR